MGLRFTASSQGASGDLKDCSSGDAKVKRCWGWGFAQIVALGFVVALAVGVAWGGLSRGPWLYDDHMVVPAALREWDGTWGGVFGGLARQARIARALSFRLDALLYGKAATVGPRIENLALHALTAWLWGLLLLRLGRRRGEAWTAAALFAVMPVCGESLGVISHRKEMLAALPMLAGVLAALAAGGRRGWRRGVWTGVAVIAMGVSALGKETALILPVLAALCVWERRRKDGGAGRCGEWRVVAALAVAAVAFGLLAWAQVEWSVEGLPGGRPEEVGARAGHLPSGAGWDKATGLALWSLPRYVGRMFAPCGHGLDSAVPLHDGAGWCAVTVGLVVAVLWMAWLAWAWRRRSDEAFPLAWMAAGLGVALAPPLLASGAVGALADRYAYVAAMGGACLLASLTGRLGRRWAMWGARALLVAVFVAGARGTAGDYASETSLWEATLRDNPGSWLAHYNLGYAAWKQRGDAGTAREHFIRMTELEPHFAQGAKTFARFLAELEGPEAAMAWLDERIEKDDWAPLRMSRGTLRSSGGDLRGAEEDFRACLAAGLDDSALHHNLGVVLQRQLRWKEAAEHFARSGGDSRLPDDAALAAALGGYWARREAEAGGTAWAVVVGDSVAAGYGSESGRSLAERLEARGAGDMRFRNLAVPGSLLHVVPEALPRALASKSVRMCILLAGHNDALAGAPVAVMMRDMADCALICRLNGVEPVIVGPVAVQSTEDRDRRRQEAVLSVWNRWLGSFCLENSIRFVGTRACLCGPDEKLEPRYLDPASGVHLTETGMEALADACRNLLDGMDGENSGEGSVR